MAGLLVADDAPIIRSTIARVVAREKTGLYPIVEAGNGQEAVELARRIRPDIVLMDIKMPGLDGLQATAIIREELPATKVIILTAYDEFPYVQKALKLGAADFLLKPVRPAKLMEVLTEVYAQIQRERHQSEEAAETKTYLQKTLPLLETSLVDQLVHGRSPGRDAVAASLKQLGKTLTWPAVIVAEVANYDAADQHSLTNPFAGLAPSNLDRSGAFLVGYSSPGRVIVIVSTDHHLAAASQLRQLGATLQQALEAKLDGLVVVGIGHRHADIEAIPISYAEASLACRHYDAGTGSKVIHIEDIDDINDRKRLAYPVQLERDILQRLRQGDLEACNGLLNQMLDHLTYQFRQKPEIMHSRLTELVALIARTIIWMGAAGPEVLQAIDYIHQHQSQPDISLNDVAVAVNLSPSYLAHLLKDRVGLSYKSYLISLRMESAKHLLRTTDMTISSVAEEVGYQNTSNFYRLFQRETGRTPAAFRRLS